MTLLITLLAAIAVSFIWYLSEKARRLHIGTLALMYWGASLMWLVDAFAEYFADGAEYFLPAAEDMRNDAFLGASAVVLGLVIYLIVVIVKDPLGTVHSAFAQRKR